MRMPLPFPETTTGSRRASRSRPAPRRTQPRCSSPSKVSVAPGPPRKTWRSPTSSRPRFPTMSDNRPRNWCSPTSPILAPSFRIDIREPNIQRDEKKCIIQRLLINPDLVNCWFN